MNRKNFKHFIYKIVQLLSDKFSKAIANFLCVSSLRRLPSAAI